MRKPLALLGFTAFAVRTARGVAVARAFGSAASGAAALSLAVGVALAGCKKPEPPQLTVKEARITSVDLAGIGVRVDVDAFNPNAVPLSVQSVTGKVLVAGNYDLGTVTVSKPISLPANAKTAIDIPLSMKWNNVATLTQIATSSPTIPFTVTGTVAVGGESLNIDVPFQAQGTIAREQLTQAALKSLPTAIPGFPNLQLAPAPAPK